MPATPSQIRSVDPWSENRFSDNFNLRSRLLTAGLDSVVFLESFGLQIISDTQISVGRGLAIKDDVLIHILEDTTIDLTLNQGYMVTGETEPPLTGTETKVLHLCLQYRYARSIPAPQARYVLMEDPTAHFSEVNHMWLGRVHITSGVVTTYTYLPIEVDGHVYSRHIINPLLGYAFINGGVIRPAIPGGSPDGWYEEWEYI